MTPLLLLLVLVVCCSGQTSRDVVIVNNKMMVDGKEFIVKGLDYSPSPIGQSGMGNSGFGGSGLCSPKLTPWGEWKSACYDSDYYDGSPDINTQRFPRGFQPIWERDFENIKATGSNTLRLYNTNPSTRFATQTYKSLFPYATGKDHTQFIKLCEQYKFYLVYPLFSDNWAYNNYDEVTFKRYLRWQIDEVGNSSSILMWQLGNEMDWTWYFSSDWNNPAAFVKYNKYADYVRRYTLSKWGRKIPVTTAVINYPIDWTYQYANFHVDIFSINIFWTNFGNTFTGDGGSFVGTTKLACQFNKPLLMTEVGCPGGGYRPGDFNTIWYRVMENIPNGLIGAIYFEHTDEPALGKDWGLWAVKAATLSDGTTSTSADSFVADAIVPKQQFYDIVNGTYNGVPYNMNSNVFSLLGRSAYNLTTAPDYCKAIDVTYKDCPGTGTPRCSGTGACDRITGTCACGVGWTGVACEIAVCPGTPACSAHGRCSTFVSPPECYCDKGYFGSVCSQTSANVPAGSCPGGCSNGNGVCNNGTCDCIQGWTGLDCAVTDVGQSDLNVAQNYQNCYTLPSTYQTNTTLVSVMSPITKPTNQKCRYYCGLRGYGFAATSRGSQCFCTNSDMRGLASSRTACSTACVGDKTQKCGATNRASLYSAGTKASLGYLGCFVDSPTRDLPVYLGDVPDIDTCRKSCASGGYAYAGLQYTSQCFCGNTYGGQGLVADSECNMQCGDRSLFCGAGWRNSIYTTTLPAGFSYN